MFDRFKKRQNMTAIFEAVDNLARKTHSIGMYLEIKQKNSFLNDSELTRTDAVIFAAFLNYLLIISEAKNESVSKQVVERYLAFVCQLLQESGGCFDGGIPLSTINKMTENRFAVYSTAFRAKTNLTAAVAALVEEFEYIIKTDIIEGKYVPFSKFSALPVLGFEKDVSCQIDARNFPSFNTTMLEKPLKELLSLLN